MVDRDHADRSRRVLAATLPVLRSRGLTALPVTYIGKAATFALMSGFPLVLLGQWDALWSRVVLACGWAFLIWGLAHVSVVGGAVPDPGGDGGAATPLAQAATTMSMLGGYDPQAGRNAHEADQPTLIPVPSLLRSLLSDHLDPGYAAAAAEQSGRRATQEPVGHARAGRCSPRSPSRACSHSRVRAGAGQPRRECANPRRCCRAASGGAATNSATS